MYYNSRLDLFKIVCERTLEYGHPTDDLMDRFKFPIGRYLVGDHWEDPYSTQVRLHGKRENRGHKSLQNMTIIRFAAPKVLQREIQRYQT